VRLAHLMERELGTGTKILAAMKRSLDPDYMLNPGKLGLGPDVSKARTESCGLRDAEAVQGVRAEVGRRAAHSASIGQGGDYRIDERRFFLSQCARRGL